MRVLAWSAMPLPSAGAYVTGVGKHIFHMLNGLAHRPGWQVQQLVTRDQAEKTEQGQANGPRVASLTMPLGRRTAEFLWRSFDFPCIDSWQSGLDWVYCPRELYIPTRKTPTAVTIHDLYQLEPKYSDGRLRARFRWFRSFQRGLEQASAVLAVSEFTKQRIVELLRISPDKIFVVGNGVEAEFFEVFKQDPETVSPLKGVRYLLSVGGLTRKKGGDDLLALAEHLGSKDPKLQLVVTGPVEAKFSTALGNLRNVRLLARGFGNADMCKLTRGALAAVVLSEYEGFGIPVLEAMAAGVPVLAADRSALPEVVGDGGILVDPKRASTVCDLALGLVNDDGLRSEMITKGRKRAKQFPWSACVSKLALALEQAAPSGRA